MTKTEINCVYGSEHQRDTLYVVDGWYVIDGSVNVNHTVTPEELVDGVDVELLTDDDCYTATKPITSLEQLEKFLEDE